MITDVTHDHHGIVVGLQANLARFICINLTERRVDELLQLRYMTWCAAAAVDVLYQTVSALQ
jgi:hypothetical protein